jgi:hypothetical protein
MFSPMIHKFLKNLAVNLDKFVAVGGTHRDSLPFGPHSQPIVAFFKNCFAFGCKTQGGASEFSVSNRFCVARKPLHLARCVNHIQEH